MKQESTYRHIQVGISNIFDYSPFGAPLDGRTIQNTFYQASTSVDTVKQTVYALNETFDVASDWQATTSYSQITYPSGKMRVRNSSTVKRTIGAKKSFVTGEGLHEVSFDITSLPSPICSIIRPPIIRSNSDSTTTTSGIGGNATLNVVVKNQNSVTITSGSYTTTGTFTNINFTAVEGDTYTIEFYINNACENTFFQVDDVFVSHKEEVNIEAGSFIVSGGYRYGYNTQERVDEIAGKGNHYTAPYWEYDPRVVHRWNRDPMAFKYPWNSPYVINNNNPIWFHDPLGDEWDTPEDKEKADDLNEKLETKKEYYKGIVDRFSDKNSKLFDKAQTALDKGKINKASKLVDRISNNLKKIREASLGVKEMERAQFELSEIDKSEVKFTFKATNNMLNETYMNESGTVVMEYSGDANAIHELAHGYQHLTGAIELVAGTRGGYYVDVSDEINAYRRQYFFSPVSVRNIRTTPKITIFSSYNITLRWLYNINIGTNESPDKPYENLPSTIEGKP